MGVQADGAPTKVQDVQRTPADLRVPGPLGAYLGRAMPDGAQWAGLDTYFVLHGMAGAEARAYTRNCSLSELCGPGRHSRSVRCLSMCKHAIVQAASML